MQMQPFQCAWIALVVGFMVISSASGEFPTTVDGKCNCYLTNTTSQSFFSSHMFFDFRNMKQYVNVTQPLQDPAANNEAGVTSPYFSTPAWKSFWEIQSWNNSARLGGESGSDAAVLMVNSPNNIYFAPNNDTKASSKTYLTLRTIRHDNFQSAAEFDSVSGTYKYLSMRMLARTRGASGAVTAMFTYRGGDASTNVQEADLEIRTKDPVNTIQYTNQPTLSNSTGSTQNITLPAHLAWSDWQHHRIDWTPGASTWFVNGKQVSRITAQTPRDPSQVLFNAWSDGGSWAGSMAIGSEAYLQIQWIDMVFNNTDAGSVGVNPNAGHGGRCSNVCSIDQTKTIGTPVLISTDARGGNYSIRSQSIVGRRRTFSG
ncbi:hypothetical protein TruAng_010286 [Truncatella angustata]|nr:hypothetical protein TruAng_010286 [Truncatella angustata]